MSTHTISPARLDSVALRKAVDGVIGEFLAQKAQAADPHMAHLTGLLTEFGAGGKRIRPLLAATGWLAVSGRPADESVVRVAAALEMFHSFALIHDDVMDDSDTRRGHPTIHRTLANHQRDYRAERFGRSGAILLGDLALTWSDELLFTAGLSPARLVTLLPLVTEMRTEVMRGQYLDVLATGELHDDVDATLDVIRYKTAKYTVERPLHIGVALAGGDADAMAACTAYALPLGEAFQLRDDLLGVYGNERDTGKSRLDDLREGKNTTLVALALRAGEGAQSARLRRLVGDPFLDESGAEEVRAVFEATGAREAVEQMIDDRYWAALRALDSAPFTAEATATLKDLARKATRRNS